MPANPVIDGIDITPALKGGERVPLPEWTWVEGQEAIVKELEGGPVSKFE